MKKFTYVLALMFSLILMSTSCEKSNDTPIPNAITTNDLVGNWNFTSLEFNGKTMTGCDIALDLYYLTTLSLNSMTKTTVIVKDACKSDNREYPYTLSNNIITLKNTLTEGTPVYNFVIENAETFNGTILKLKFESAPSSNNLFPIHGIYTLTKQK